MAVQTKDAVLVVEMLDENTKVEQFILVLTFRLWYAIRVIPHWR